MSWIGVGVATVGAISGAEKARANRKKQRQHDTYRKAAITYSPWTGMGDPGAGNFGNQDTFSGMLGGAAQGYALGSGVGGAFKSTPALTGAPDFGKVSANGWSGADGLQGVGTQLPAANSLPQNLGANTNLAMMSGSAGAYGSQPNIVGQNFNWQNLSRMG